MIFFREGEPETNFAIFSRNSEKDIGGKIKTSPEYHMIYRPGFTRLSFPFDLSGEEVDFIIEAVKMIAKDGWKMCWQYTVCPTNGVYKYFKVRYIFK